MNRLTPIGLSKKLVRSKYVSTVDSKLIGSGSTRFWLNWIAAQPDYGSTRLRLSREKNREPTICCFNKLICLLQLFIPVAHSPASKLYEWDKRQTIIIVFRGKLLFKFVYIKWQPLLPFTSLPCLATRIRDLFLSCDSVSVNSCLFSPLMNVD